MKKTLVTKQNLIIGAVVIVALAVLYFGQGASGPVASDADRQAALEAFDITLARELDSTVYFKVPKGGEHNVKFSVFVNDNDVIGKVESVDLLDPEDREKLDEFSDELLKAIGGRKLSDLEEVDRVGTSSLTTGAFNKALPELKAQL